MQDSRVVLVRPKYAENVGFVARCMKFFGTRQLGLVEPRFDSIDLARKTASGAEELIDNAICHDSLQQAVKDCHQITAFSRRKFAIKRPHYQSNEWFKKTKPVSYCKRALVFGPEDFGLSLDDLKHCHEIVSIQGHDESLSLNLSHAVGIVLHALSTGYGDDSEVVYYQMSTVSQEYNDRLIEQLGSLLDDANYFKDELRNKQEDIVRNLVYKMNLNDKEYQGLMGILRALRKDNPKRPK